MRRLLVKGDVPFAPGRPGVTVRAHYGALPLAAGRVRVKAGESRPDDGRCVPCPVPGSTVPWPKIVAVARRQALRGSGLPAIRQAGAASVPPLAPCGVPPPLMSSRGDLLTPRTRKRRENGIAWVKGPALILNVESQDLRFQIFWSVVLRAWLAIADTHISRASSLQRKSRRNGDMYGKSCAPYCAWFGDVFTNDAIVRATSGARGSVALA